MKYLRPSNLPHGIMKKLSILLLFIVALIANSAQAQSKAAEYQKILDQAHANGLPAVVALVQSSEGEWTGKAGLNSMEEETPLNINQTFRLASITKMFTAIVVLQLVQEQSISLSDPIVKYLDEETISKIPYANDITILHLLSHCSGIYSFTENNSFWKECYLNDGMSRTWQPSELLSYIENKNPISRPVEPYSNKLYSNTNFILLGMMIEKVTGQNLVHEYQNRIFIPLKMKDTYLEGYDSLGRKPIDSYALPYSTFLKSAIKKREIEKVKESEWINLSKEYSLFNSWAWAAGGISSNLNDLNIFLSAARKGELLNQETQKVLVKLNSSEDKGIHFFGGTGGSDGIQATALHLMPSDLVIILLINSSRQNEVNLSSVFKELYKTATN